MRNNSKIDVLIVGPIPPAESYIGGIGVLIRMQLGRWDLPISVAHFNTDLWARDYGKAGKFRLERLFAFFLNAFRLTWTILQRRPALVHFHSSKHLGLFKDMLLACWLRWICQRRVILQIHYAIADVILFPRSAFWRRRQLWLLMGSCDRIVFLSRGVIADLAQMLPAKGAARLQAKSALLPNFTELPDQSSEHHGHGVPVNILFVGNIGKRKGAYDLVPAARILVAQSAAPFQMVFAGPFDSTEDEKQIMGMVTEQGLCDFIKFLGPVAGQAKIDSFLNADIFVLPSYGEGVPLAMLEAMAYALPIVVTDVGGIPETVTDGREGFVLRPGQIETLAAALNRLITEPELRCKMGCAGRARVERCYSVKVYFKALECLYGELGMLPGVHFTPKQLAS